MPDHAVKKFVINEDGRTVLRQMKFQNKPFMNDFVELVVLERNAPFGSEKKTLYSDRSNLQTRLNKWIKAEDSSSGLTSEVTRLDSALAKNPQSEIFLNGTDE